MLDITQKKFNKETVEIVYVTSSEYFPVLNVSLISLLVNCREDMNYRISVLNTGIERFDEDIAIKQFQKDNVSIDFINICEKIKELVDYSYNSVFNISYTRMLLPWILNNYKKIIFLENDTIITSDITDVFFSSIPNSNMVICSIHSNIIDTGCMILNLQTIRNRYTLKQMLDVLYQSDMNERLSFNKIFSSCAYNLGETWTIQPNLIKELELIKNSNTKVIHYVGLEKPWVNTSILFAEDWWFFARKSSYYEELLRRMCLPKNDNRSNIRRLFDFVFPKNTKRRRMVKNLIVAFNKGNNKC